MYFGKFDMNLDDISDLLFGASESEKKWHESEKLLLIKLVHASTITAHFTTTQTNAEASPIAVDFRQTCITST